MTGVSAPHPGTGPGVPAGAAEASRYLHGLGRSSPSGRHATRRDHPQPALAWAGSQGNGGAEPDPRDEP